MNSSLKQKIDSVIPEAGFLAQLGLDKLPADRQKDLLKSATNSVLNILLLKLEKILSQKEMEQVIKLSEQENDQEALDQLSIKVPNLDELLLASVQEYQAEIDSQFKEATRQS